MDNATILDEARALCEKSNALWYVIGWKTASVFAFICAGFSSFITTYLISPERSLLELLLWFVPRLLVVPLVWFVYRKFKNPLRKQE